MLTRGRRRGRVLQKSWDKRSGESGTPPAPVGSARRKRSARPGRVEAASDRRTASGRDRARPHAPGKREARAVLAAGRRARQEQLVSTLSRGPHLVGPHSPAAAVAPLGVVGDRPHRPQPAPAAASAHQRKARPRRPRPHRLAAESRARASWRWRRGSVSWASCCALGLDGEDAAAGASRPRAATGRVEAARIFSTSRGPSRRGHERARRGSPASGAPARTWAVSNSRPAQPGRHPLRRPRPDAVRPRQDHSPGAGDRAACRPSRRWSARAASRRWSRPFQHQGVLCQGRLHGAPAPRTRDRTLPGSGVTRTTHHAVRSTTRGRPGRPAPPSLRANAPGVGGSPPGRGRRRTVARRIPRRAAGCARWDRATVR